MWQELSQTLVQLVEAVQAPEGTGLTVSAADIEMPLEVSCAWRGEGIVFLARPPHTRWQGGFLPHIHRGRLKVELSDLPFDAAGLATEKGGGA